MSSCVCAQRTALSQDRRSEVWLERKRSSYTSPAARGPKQAPTSPSVCPSPSS
eukprot:CAMPEP_0171071834 /NCGR_PEP_ID=MMETSP0766_2-20121228/10530_1 /TAXON_ID=439317 /ORGANISM="Gambierdiscus australes, Strain CAWD 149" /LENGTH=52 /DNA_ID=CAMNT_0011528387 /DNA_START=13 /DNA_END=168 /DNA_ORIENTATION=+